MVSASISEEERCAVRHEFHVSECRALCILSADVEGVMSGEARPPRAESAQKRGENATSDGAFRVRVTTSTSVAGGEATVIPEFKNGVERREKWIRGESHKQR